MNPELSSRTRANGHTLPGEVLEQVLVHVPFQDRVQAAAVCRAWHQHLSQRGLLLWQAANIVDHPMWGEDDIRLGMTERTLRLFLSLQRWLQRHGGGLLQLQCSTAFDKTDLSDDTLLAAFLATLASTSPSLQALRLDSSAMWDFGKGSLAGVASMGSRLRQLALLGLQRVSDESVMAALAQLPMLQDLAVLFQDESVRIEKEDWLVQTKPPDTMRLLDGIAMSCTALQTLALGHLPGPNSTPRWSGVLLNGKPVPASLSRLTALSSLALQNVGWEHAPGGLPRLPQLRRLNLRGDSTAASRDTDGLQHQPSSLRAVEALQVMLPDWPGRLPPGLTQLVLAPLDASSQDAPDHAVFGRIFLREHLPPLRALRHLAFHGLDEVSASLLPELCKIVRALPQLVSLHLVKCGISTIPAELCGLSRLQLLNLSHNWILQQDGYGRLMDAPLHKLASCLRLDLRCQRTITDVYDPIPLHPLALRAIVRMPALEQLALPLPLDVVDASEHVLIEHGEEEARLAVYRAQGLPPIRVEADMPQSDRWGAVDVELPFEGVNDMLGVQLDRSIAQGVQIDM